LSVGYQRRYWAIYRTLAREIRSGRWGKVRAVSSHNVENWMQTIAGTWRDDPLVNTGGFIGDAGSHKIDVVFHVTGLSPVEVFARCDRCGSSVEIVSSVSALLTGGVPFSIDFVGHGQYLGEELSIHLETADFVVRDFELWIGRNEKLERFTELEPDSNPDSGFLDSLFGQAENVAPAECALPVFDFTHAILDSCRTGANVRVGASL
jgi:predicted dehydrogenase